MSVAHLLQDKILPLKHCLEEVWLKDAQRFKNDEVNDVHLTHIVFYV